VSIATSSRRSAPGITRERTEFLRALASTATLPTPRATLMQLHSSSIYSQAEMRCEVLPGLIARTLEAQRLDEELWALIVTRLFGQPSPCIAWLQEDELRMLGDLDASLCLARTILPTWCVRLISHPGKRPIAYCERRGWWLGPSSAADEALAVCAALLRAVLAVARFESRPRALPSPSR